MLGQNRKGIYFIKLYFPLKKKKKKENKFVTNCNVLEGLPNLELNDYDYIIITKSSKDRLSLGSYIDSHPFYGAGNAKLHIGIVNLPSENYKLNEKEYEYLSNKLADNGMIFSLLDFDTTGRNGARYLKETYNIPYLFITRGELGLPDYKAKDFADLHDVYSKEQIDQFLKETVTYVEIRYKSNDSCYPDADFSGLLCSDIPY